jgi:ferrochelatase
MTGILLLNLGGPDSLDAVRPFLYNLFSDRDIIRLGPPFMQKPLAALISALRSGKTREAYAKIGGKSPILDITTAQARALEETLRAASQGQTASARSMSATKVYVGMRYWHPLTEDTVARMHREGVTRVLCLSLYPHYSIATTGSSVARFEEVAKRYPIEHHTVTSWFDHPLYIKALVEHIEEGIASFPEKPAVLFSAHSLPKKFIDEGDPYVRETEGTIDAILKRLDLEWYLSYQSKTGPVKWLEPTTEHMLHRLSEQGVKRLLVVPISFVSDHIETLYEIDILYRDLARSLGIDLRRARSLNTSATFIEALADMSKKEIDYLKWR